jgi:enoyl-CoA hydratase/long-chain 3-hydroxyacyl-CoA dehydrogenase
LACHYRIALNDKRTGFGVPEIKLGLLPGAGGTQRLVQKLSLPDALDLILTGKEVKAKKAKSMGLVDDLVEPIGPGLQAAEAKNMDYLRTVAVQKAKYVHILITLSSSGCGRHFPLISFSFQRIDCTQTCEETTRFHRK